MLKVLIACEESQEVCKAFRELGHEAYSCDLMECSGGHPEWHIQGDCLPLLNGNTSFTTVGGGRHEIKGQWDLIIAHPPCTRLCSSGQRWLYYGSKEYQDQKKKDQEEGINFFMKFTNINCDHVAIENPVGIMSTLYRKPDCIYNPYDFKGETDSKKTCLWLKGLPALIPNQHLDKDKRTQNIWKATFNGKHYGYGDPQVAILRSKTPKGVAKAMGEQWSRYIEEEKIRREN